MYMEFSGPWHYFPFITYDTCMIGVASSFLTCILLGFKKGFTFSGSLTPVSYVV